MSDKDVTKEQKLALIASRIREVKIYKFNAELTIIEQNAVQSPIPEIVENANKIIDNADDQIAALEAHYTSINAGQYVSMETPKTKNELMIIALQQRIGEMAANYEGQIASLRADLTQLMEIAKITEDKET